MIRALGEKSWPEAEAGAAGALLVVPLGATEQHGPHLPLSTDSEIALALARELSARRPEVVVAPLLPYGSSGEHGGFAGTLSIGREATELVLLELCRSASATYDRVLLISAHGGNAEPLRRAVATLRAEGRDVRSWSPCWGGDAHAGESETSLMLAIDPRLVASERAAPGNVEPIELLIDDLIEVGVREISGNGVLGDPREASAAHGRELLEGAVAELVRTIETWGAARPEGVGR